MKDNFFKNLPHNADNYEIVTSGQEVMKGYKPDFMLKNGNDHILMECDTSTTRKGYLGGMIKAAKFLTQDKKGVLLLVLKEKENTTALQIFNHIKPYYLWISPLTNLRAVYVISTEQYCSVDIPLKLLDKEFFM